MSFSLIVLFSNISSPPLSLTFLLVYFLPAAFHFLHLSLFVCLFSLSPSLSFSLTSLFVFISLSFICLPTFPSPQILITENIPYLFLLFLSLSPSLSYSFSPHPCFSPLPYFSLFLPPSLSSPLSPS